jgi:hypothetical protein
VQGWAKNRLLTKFVLIYQVFQIKNLMVAHNILVVVVFSFVQ